MTPALNSFFINFAEKGEVVNLKEPRIEMPFQSKALAGACCTLFGGTVDVQHGMFYWRAWTISAKAFLVAYLCSRPRGSEPELYKYIDELTERTLKSVKRDNRLIAALLFSERNNK